MAGMDENEFPREEAPLPHLSLDRQVTVGATEYLITATDSGASRIDLAIVACDRDGRVVSEICGGISPNDLPAVADVLSSTLAGLVALRQSHRVIPQRVRPPNQGAGWTAEDDARLLARHRDGATDRQLATELGRTRGGIRLRLERLGAIPADRRSPPSAAAV